jgi:putative two-component system response regulator
MNRTQPRKAVMKIAIVDDNMVNVRLTEALVGQLDDCASVSFTDPVAGLAWCRANPFDLLIVDYMMPTLDGIELITSLRATAGRGEVPVLMVTASNERDVLYRALEAGATDFLTKPIDTVEFGARVRNMLAIRKSHVLLANRAADLAEEVRAATVEILAREKDTIMRLSKAAEFRDPETGAHILRMAHYSRLIAEELSDDRTFIDSVFEAAPMHDVGKLGTPDHILLKPGKLTPEEFEVMKDHAAIGWSILKDSASPILKFAAEIALSHHEKFDGSGYPSGLTGEAIPLSGRIVAVADVFDALTSARPYKPAWEIPRAVEHMRQNRGTHFDPDCVDAFFSRWEDVLEIRERYKDEEAQGPPPR